jgi:serine/threonine protein kinase
MSKLIDQGGFGCVFYPGIECDGSISKNPKYISKLHKKNYHVLNEYNVGKMVTKIPLYEYYFAPIVNMCNIDIAKIDKRERDMCRVVTSSKSDSKFVIMKMPYIKNVSLIKYITNPNIEKKEIIAYVVDSYKFLLNSLKMLNMNGIIHFDFKIPNILIDIKTKNPIVIDFGLSIPVSNLTPKTYSKYFYTHTAAYYIWPIDVHIINYVINVNSNLTYEELVVMVDTSINANPALKIFSDSFIKKFHDLTIKTYKKYINMPAENVVTELVKNCNTWDNYALSEMFLCLINFISNDGFTDNKLIKEFSEILLLNIHPNAAKRLSFDDTKKKYNKLFSLDVSVVGYESVLNNFDKKIFSNKMIKESMQQEKLTPDVLKVN